MDGQYYNLWSTDNDKTDANDDVVIKSVYDPSPVGYSLPASNAFTGFTTTGNYTATSSEFNVKGDFDKGWYFYTKPGKIGDKIFFNVTGNRYYSTGALENFYNRGHYLSAGPGNLNYSRFFDFGAGYVNPLNNYNKGYCFTVRSAEEKKWRCVGWRKLQCADFLTSESEEEHVRGAKMQPLTVVYRDWSAARVRCQSSS